MPKTSWRNKSLEEQVRDAHRAYREVLALWAQKKISVGEFNDVAVGYVALLEAQAGLTDEVTQLALDVWKETQHADAKS